MKTWLIFLLLLLSSLALADEVKIEINPTKPVAGEVFQAMFRVFTESDEEPAITFSPAGLEVVGKSNQGVSTRTVYANGSLTVSREIMVVYDLVASKPGTSYMRDINVTVGSKTLRHNSVSINVLKEPEQAADVFVMADVSKNEIFIGEGITVRYYLYSRVPVNNLDIKKYPKLNNFLKRFLQEPDRAERVSVRGEVYLRTQIYAAKLFPEQLGTLKIDALTLNATYPQVSNNDPFGAFGLSRNYKSRTLNSEVINIEVKPLPQPVPGHFTGLVGEHEINLSLNQQKLIVNEPLELKLTISGPGALEKLEAPTLIKHEGLEEFESTGDLKITDADTATKVFDYTFLAKQNLSIPASKITLSYLEPASGKYIAKELDLGEITVAGGNATAQKNNKEPEKKSPQDSSPDQPRKPLELSGPIFTDTSKWSELVPVMNVALLTLALAFAAFWFVRSRPDLTNFSKHHIPADFKKGQFSFGELARWMSPLILKSGKSPLLIIKDSDLDEPAKAYFTELFESLDKKEYANRKTEVQMKYNASYFKKLAAYIEKIKNENYSESA